MVKISEDRRRERGAEAPDPGQAAVAWIIRDESAQGGQAASALPRADALQAGARRLGQAASGVGGASPARLASVVQNVLDFLVREAIPRLQAEREVLFPVLERALGTPGATAPLEVEHAEIRMQTERLGSLAQHLNGPLVGGSERRAVERVLMDVSRLLLGHLEREASLCAEARAVEPELDAGWESLAQTLEEAERRASDSVVLVVEPAVGSQAAIVMRHNPAANRPYITRLADLARDRESRTGPRDLRSRHAELGQHLGGDRVGQR